MQLEMSNQERNKSVGCEIQLRSSDNRKEVQSLRTTVFPIDLDKGTNADELLQFLKKN